MSTRHLSGRLIAGLWMLLLPCAIAYADLTIKFELKEGDKVSDVATVVARVKTSDDTGIEKVEFSLDNQLKATDVSTPYSFDWDTLAGEEGNHTLAATAFDAKGRTASAKISVTVDNGLDKGAEYHAAAALSALKEGDAQVAARYARRALKIEPKNLRAARALAGIYRQNREYAQAIAVLEKADIPANDVDTRVDLVALHIAQGGAADTTDEFLKRCASAIEVQNQITAIRLEAAKNASEAWQRGDAYFAARDWKSAILEYQKCSSKDDSPMACVNRLILAYLYAGRVRDANTLIGNVTRARRADAVTQAISGYLLLLDHKAAEALKAVQAGVENKSLPALMIAAQAEFSLGHRDKAERLAEQAAALAPRVAEVQLLRAQTFRDPIDARNALQRALSYDPTLAEAYALRGFHAMLGRGDRKKYLAADPLFDFALRRDPKNNYALMGAALSLMAQKRPNEADPLLIQLLAQDKNAPDAYVAMALNYSLADKSVKINAALETARRLNDDRWNYALVPVPAELIPRVYGYRTAPILTPASLYPPASEEEEGEAR